MSETDQIVGAPTPGGIQPLHFQGEVRSLAVYPKKIVMVGKTLSHYRIIDELGRGGMGVVYKAEDTKLDRTVALKFLAAHLMNDPTSRERFIREARAAAMLQHDNICAVHEVQDLPDGGIFIVMPLYEGQSLKEIIEEGPMDPDKALAYVCQIAEGLQAAAAKDLVHRDIKPGNIFVTPNNRVKILDFGLAKFAGNIDLTATQGTVGTMAYMSPEQVQGQGVDSRSDLWSVGVVFYEMVTGTKLFEGAYEAAVIYSIVNQDVDLDHPKIPDAFRPVLARLLEKNPDKRVGHADELLALLPNDASSTSESIPTAPASSTVSVAKEPAPTNRRWWIPATAVAVLVVGFLGSQWMSAPSNKAIDTSQSTTIRTIAVMPFENAGGDADVQFLCDGIAESLINWLAGVPDVKVISKSAAFRQRDHMDDTAKLAETLGITGVIRGRLENVGGQIVVSASFVNTSDDSQMWGDRIVRPESEVIQLEQSIVSAIKDGLQLEVSGSVAAANVTGGTENAEAYNHYLRGHYLIQSTDPLTIDEGLDELREAIRLDPRFARPYADIADALSQMISYGTENFDQLVEEARGAAYTAVALAPDLAEAQTALATILQFFVFDWPEVDKAYEAAIALSPQSPVPYHRYTDYLVLTLRFKRAQEMADRAIEADALDGSSLHAAGLVPLISGDFARAARAFGDWNRFHPESRWSLIKHALALSLDGQCDAALGQATKAEELLNGKPPPLMDSWLAWGYYVCGNTERYTVSKSRIQAARDKNPSLIDPGFLYLAALEGDTEGLVDLISRVVETKDPLTPFMQIFLLENLGWGVSGKMSSNPRYLAILDELDFPPRD